MCPLGVLAVFRSDFWVQFEANPCDEADCGLVFLSLVL